MSGSWAKPPRSRLVPVIALALGLGALIVYLSTLAPTVATNDAGRFQIAAPLLGTGHPTGYPTFILLGKLFTYLPFGDTAYRMNVMAAVFGGLAAALLFLVALQLRSRLLPALGAALLLSFSATFWSQATFAEVYTMHAAFLLGIACLLLRWRGGGGDVNLLGAGLLYGLSLGNNAGMVLLAPAYLVLLASGWRKLSARLLAGAAVLCLLGLSVYLYIPLRGFAGAWHNYGDPVHTWGDVWRLVSGARFQGLMGASPLEMLANGEHFLRELSLQIVRPFGYVLAALLLAGGLYGGGVLLRRDRAAGAALVLGLACTLLYALSYRIDDISVYYIPVYSLLFLLSSVAVSRFSTAPGGPALLAVPLLAAVLALYLNYPEQDRSAYHAERERSEDILARLPEDAVLYGKVPIIPVTYLTEVEGAGGDVTLRWLDGATLEKHLAEDLESGRPVYFISDERHNAEYLGELPSGVRTEEGRSLIRLTPQ